MKQARLLAQFDHINIVHYYECVLEVRILGFLEEGTCQQSCSWACPTQAQE